MALIPSRSVVLRGSGGRRLVLLLVGAALWVAACQPLSPRLPNAHRGAPSLVLPAGLSLEEGCTPSGPELCFNAIDDNCNGLFEEGCGLQTGPVQFLIAWEDPDLDLDLEVTDPIGEVAKVGSLTAAGLTKERDCPGAAAACGGQNGENVYLAEGDPTPGVYRVRVLANGSMLESAPARADVGRAVSVRLAAVLGSRAFAAKLELELASVPSEWSFELRL